METREGPGDVTALLRLWSEGEAAALDRMTPLVYDQLRAVAKGLLRSERPGHTLQATALVNEAFEKLLHVQRLNLNDRIHFFAFAAKLMRRILIDHARRMKTAKRGQLLARVPLNPEVGWVGPMEAENLDLAAALEELESLDAQKARAVELRYFLGCSINEIAELLETSPSTVDRNVRFSLAWLRQRLHSD